MTDTTDAWPVPSPSSYDPEMENILQTMLDSDEDITARGVIRRHSTLSAASSITRNRARLAILSAYQSKQKELRSWRKRLAKRSTDSAAMSLAEKDIRIAELERQIELLTASHVAMIRAVGECGGFDAWGKFFPIYREVRTELVKMGAMPTAKVFSLGELEE